MTAKYHDLVSSHALFQVAKSRWLVKRIRYIDVERITSTSCMYGHHIIARVWINRGRLPILLVLSLTGKMKIPFLSAFAPENVVSRDGFGSPVPRQPAYLLLRLNLMLTYGITPEFRGGVHLFLLKPPYAIGSVPSLSGHAIGTNDVHSRESAGTGPVNLKVVPVTGAAISGITMDYELICAYLSHNPNMHGRAGFTALSCVFPKFKYIRADGKPPFFLCQVHASQSFVSGDQYSCPCSLPLVVGLVSLQRSDAVQQLPKV